MTKFAFVIFSVETAKRAMGLRRDLLYSVCETFYSLFETHHDSLVKQALSCGLVKEFLELLDSPLPEVSSPSACKALIVKAVKALQVSQLSLICRLGFSKFPRKGHRSQKLPNAKRAVNSNNEAFAFGLQKVLENL